VEATFMGDEHVHFFRAEDGRCFQLAADGEHYLQIDPDTLQSRWTRKLQQQALRHEAKRVARRKAWGDRSNPVSGVKKGLVILVNFSDRSMYYGNDDYQRFFNEEGYKEHGMQGSVHDYFFDQSYGKFNLTFDVAGPVTLSQSMSYYGQNDSDGNDLRPGEMIAEACTLVDGFVDFSDYDWDGNGQVDQVFVIYAGYGENSSNVASQIWPHEYDLTSAFYYGDGPGPLVLDGVTVDTYACGNELANSSGTDIQGIGTACHEFSHCMCIPDMYDTSAKGSAFGMATYDLMDMGSYNGGNYQGLCPAPYTSWERMYCGWLTPKKLDSTCQITDMQPITSAPEAYIIYNSGYSDEYYLLENHQQESWDTECYGHGMLILHVDFDKSDWIYNTVNADANHQRMSYIPADGRCYLSISSLANDLWPGGSSNTQLSATTTPAATLFHANASGDKTMEYDLKNIVERNGLISFLFLAELQSPQAYPASQVLADGFTASWSQVDDVEAYEVELLSRPASVAIQDCVVLNEDFSSFANGLTSDSNKDVSVSLDELTSSSGWTGKYLYKTPDDQVRLGNSKSSGMIVTPSFYALSGTVTVAFTARKYEDDGGVLLMSVNGTIATIKNTESELQTYVISVPCDAECQITFATKSKRAYLSRVIVFDGEYTSDQVLSYLSTEPSVVLREVSSSSATTSSLSYAFTGLSQNSFYSYRVRSLYDDTCSEWSSMIPVSLQGQSAIESVPASSEEPSAVYDLQGRKVMEVENGCHLPLNRLPRGIYLINGRKVMVR